MIHDTARLLEENVGWVRGHWWYNVAHVCRRWKNILLGSASHLVSLFCTNCTPDEDMLVQLPPLPLLHQIWWPFWRRWRGINSCSSMTASVTSAFRLLLRVRKGSSWPWTSTTFSGRLATWSIFALTEDTLLRNCLVVWIRKTGSSHWSCYLNCRNSHVSELGGSCGAFRLFIDARKNTGLPVYLIYHLYLYR